ncbi:MAG: tRNA (adenosine(37)-N6)-threonylcarbamoyltransferase complex dimerization subunit type 1 TsaB, partial [Saezia sp.]
MNLLAFDTSTQTLGIALYWNDQLHIIEDEGGARTSDILLPRIAELLDQHQAELKRLDAIAFGAGPGAFTGLRAAAAAAQGMAFGANLPVIPVITLHAGAQEYLIQHAHEFEGIAAPDILVQLDARMNEWYWAHYQWKEGEWHTLAVPALSSPDVLQAYQEHTHPAK